MRISELVSHWERDAKGRMSHTTYSIPLDVESAARLAALAEMYPKRSTEALLGELVGAALEAVETSLPYVRGTHVIATDEQGDPVYEDVAPPALSRAVAQAPQAHAGRARRRQLSHRPPLSTAGGQRRRCPPSPYRDAARDSAWHCPRCALALRFADDRSSPPFRRNVWRRPAS